MNDEQRKAMFAQMRENATELHLDPEGVFSKDEPRTDRKIILQRQFNHAQEMKDKHDKWTKSQESEKPAEPESDDENLYSYVTLEDGTSVRWTPELEKTLLKIQNQRFAKELEKEYGLKEDDKEKIRQKLENKKYERDLEEELGLSESQMEELEQKAQKKIKNDESRGLIGENQINPDFNSSIAEILH